MIVQVDSNKLLNQLLSFVEVPQLDQWKMDELKRLLDPKQDNRKVNMEEFVAVGRTWFNMISDPGKRLFGVQKLSAHHPIPFFP